MITNTNGLTIQEIAAAFPSVVATAAHESRSEKYLYIPTHELLGGLADAEFIPTSVMQAKARRQGHAAFTKHLIRLRHVSDLGDWNPDVHEVLLINSHNGTSSYQLMEGVFRTVCENGLVTGDIDHTLRVQHRGNALDEVICATYQIVEEGRETMGQIQEMKQILLSRGEQLLLAEHAMYARFDPEVVDADDPAWETHTEVPYQPEDFLRRARLEDQGNDLYTTLNVVQEHIIRGGVSRRNRKTGKRHTLRPINEVGANVKLNRLLWSLAQKMSGLKQ